MIYTCIFNHKSINPHTNYITKELECGRHHCTAPLKTCEHCGQIHEEHHPFCNYWVRDRWACRQCKDLYKNLEVCKYENVTRLVTDQFPDAIIRV